MHTLGNPFNDNSVKKCVARLLEIDYELTTIDYFISPSSPRASESTGRQQPEAPG